MDQFLPSIEQAMAAASNLALELLSLSLTSNSNVREHPAQESSRMCSNSHFCHSSLYLQQAACKKTGYKKTLVVRLFVSNKTSVAPTAQVECIDTMLLNSSLGRYCPYLNEPLMVLTSACSATICIVCARGLFDHQFDQL